MTKKKKGYNKYLVFMAIIIGFLIGIQFEYGLFTNMEPNFVARELTSQINHERKLLLEAERNYESLEKSYDKIVKTYSNEENLKLQNILKQKMSIVGYGKTFGKGYILNIDSDNDENIAASLESRRILIKIINDLKKNGGEAIALNGQRLISSSDIILAGSLINVNNVPIGPPYEISVIGDYKAIDRYYNKDSNYLRVLKSSFGVEVTIEEYDSLSLPAISKPQKNSYIIS